MTSDQTKVAIIGGDPVVGRTLETLLQDAGYHARFLSQPAPDELGEQLAAFQLLLIAPPLSDERREALRYELLGPRALGEMPVLELLSTNGGEPLVRGAGILFWPCSAEKLRHAIDALVATN